jgi:hypothetical protein
MGAPEDTDPVLEGLLDGGEGFAIADQASMICAFAAQPDDLG